MKENKSTNKYLNERNVLVFFLFSILSLISTLVFVNFEIIAYQVKSIMNNVKLEFVDVDGFQISQVIIDSDGREYNSSYTWNAYSNTERRTFTLQINYKKTNNKTYEPGELVFIVPNMFTKKSTNYNSSDNTDSVIVSSNPCSLSEKVTTWNWSYDLDRCNASNSNKISTYYRDYFYFKNTERVDGSTNFEGSIRILFNEIYPSNLLNGLDNTFQTTLNNQVSSNSLRFRFTSNKMPLSVQNRYRKITGYDGLPSNASNYIWVRIDPYHLYDKTSGVRYLKDTESDGTEHQLSGGLSYKPRKYGYRYRFSLPSNAIVYSPNEAYTYETENGYGYYRFNNNYYYYNGEPIGYGDDDIYIGLPKSQYTNTTVSITTYLYGLYADYYNYFDDTRTHSYEYIASETKSINTADYYYETPSTDDLYTTSQYNYVTLDVNNLKSGSDIQLHFHTVYTGTKMNVKVGNDVIYKKTTGGSISKMSDSYYYYHKIRWFDGLRDSSSNSLLPIHDIELYVRHRGSSSYVKYGETFTNDGNRKEFVFEENDIVGFYFMIYDVDTSIDPYSRPIEFNVVYTGNISQGDTIYNSSYIEAYRSNSSSVIYTPSSNVYNNISDIGSYLKSYDSSTYGRYIRRSVSSKTAKRTYTYLWDDSNSISSSMYKRNVYQAYESFDPLTFAYDNTGFIKENKGYEMYLLLPEGFYTDSQKLVEVRCNYDYSSYNVYFQNGFIKKQDGTSFNDGKEYCNYVKDHMTTQVVNNWKNTNRTLMKAVVDFRDAPLDFTDFHYYHPYMFPNTTWYNTLHLPEYFSFYFYYDKENIAEYNQTKFDIPHYLKPIGVTVPTNTDFSYAVRDELDIDSNGNSSEYITGGNSYINVLFTGESNQDLMNFVRSEDDQYNSEYTLVTANDTYSYKLRARTATNKITNLVIYDNIENNIKEDGQFVKASGDITNTFKGTFLGVDTSYARNQGYYVKVYYSESDTPGTLGSDSSWKTYSESSTDKSKVKSLAFEYYNSSGSSKAIIPTEALTYVVINMRAPNNIDGNKVVTYNGAWSEWNALDYNNNVVPNVVGISSNKVSTAIRSTLKVKHYYKGTTTAIAPAEEYETFGGYEYTTKKSTEIPSDYTLDSTGGDPTSGVISKILTEVIYYYKKKDPILSGTINKTGTDTIDARNKTVSYQITYTPTVRDFIGTANVTIVDSLPYEIDTTKEYNLDGGTYDATNKTITWNKTITTTSISQASNTFTFNISFSFKDIPIIVRSVTNKVTGTISALDKTNSKESTKSTSITEKFKLTVHHYYKGTTDSISPDVVTYEDGGAAYNTSPADVPADYDIETPYEASGTIEQENTEVTYYYIRKDPILSGSMSSTGPESITSFDDVLEYTINYTSTFADYVGNVKLTIVDQLPYEIDTEKEYDLDGGTYDAENKTITWVENYNKTGIESETKEYAFNIKFVYKDVSRTERAIINRATGRTEVESKSLQRITSYATSNDVKGKIIVRYINIDTEEDLEEQVESEDIIFTNKFIPEAKDIDTFDLVESPEESEYDYEEETKTLYYKYKKRRHKIITKVIGSNGSIQGDEEIDEGTDSTEGKISIKADEGFRIAKITVNDEEIEIKEGLTEYTLDYFKDVREDKLILVEFAEQFKNPPTGAFMSVITVMTLIAGSGLLYLYYKKHRKFKKI